MTANTDSVVKLCEAEGLEDQAKHLLEKGSFSQVESLLQKALELKVEVGPELPAVGMTNDLLGQYYVKVAKYDEAEAQFRASIAILEKAYYAEHPTIGLVVEHLAECLFEAKKYDKAEPELQRALTLRQKGMRGDHYTLVPMMLKLIDSLLAGGKAADAEKILKTAVKECASPWGPIEEIQLRQARLAKAQGKLPEALKAYEDAASSFQQRGRTVELIACLNEYKEALATSERTAEQPEVAEKIKALEEWLTRKGKALTTLAR